MYKIRAIFGIYEGDCEPSLLDAWDPNDIEENPDGFSEKLKHFQDFAHVSHVTVIDLGVSYEKVCQQVFREPTVIDCEVK